MKVHWRKLNQMKQRGMLVSLSQTLFPLLSLSLAEINQKSQISKGSTTHLMTLYLALDAWPTKICDFQLISSLQRESVIVFERVTLTLLTKQHHKQTNQTKQTHLLSIPRNTIAMTIHLTHQHLHINITSFSLFKSIFEPPFHTICHHPRKWHTPRALSHAATLHPSTPQNRIFPLPSYLRHKIIKRGFSKTQSSHNFFEIKNQGHVWDWTETRKEAKLKHGVVKSLYLWGVLAMLSEDHGWRIKKGFCSLQEEQLSEAAFGAVFSFSNDVLFFVSSYYILT